MDMMFGTGNKKSPYNPWPLTSEQRIMEVLFRFSDNTGSWIGEERR
jgi:hypothetical protein